LVSLKNTLSLQKRISTIKAAKSLAKYLLLSSRLGDLEEWINLYNPETGRIHGTFNGIGSWTYRKSHQRPNMANIPALVNRSGRPQPYGEAFRSLWTAGDGRVLVGCDAEGIQLRLFAHFCNDRKLIEAITQGRKEDKTDIHSLNMQVLNPICNTREVAKTYIYALLLGAGKGKQAQILSCSPKEAEAGLNRILQFYPGWKELKETRLKKDAEVGYFEGLDGRLVMFPAAHYILAGYLQNGESVVMKMASVLWTTELDRLGIPYSFVNDVHDEWQTETLPEYAEKVGELQADSIRRIGEELGLNCPLAGKYVIWKNWKETH
jgi:DNA polymerase-1